MTTESLSVTIEGELLTVEIGTVAAPAGGGGGSAAWGDITGTLSAQTDLNSALGLKAPLASPTLTGTPAAPTAAGGTSTTQIATTAFAAGEITTHAAATDPHGDRAFAASAVSTHNAVTTAHGISAFGATLVDDADAATARTTLGLGTLATQSGTFSGTSSGTNTGDQTNITGNAATVTTNANLTGHVTSVGNAAVLGSFTVAQLNTAISDADVATGGGTATGTNTGDQTNVTGYAEALKSATTTVSVSAATAPSSGQVLTATSSTAATWQTPSGGSSNTKWVGAGELIPRVTNGAGIDGEELATNDINLDYLAFDSATSEGAQVSFAWPGAYTTFTATFHWTAASGSGTVTWTAAARCYADDDALDQAQGTAQSVTDTLLAANDAHKSSATSAVTPGGTVASGNLTVAQFTRDIADTLAVDARLIGVMLEFA